MIGHAAAVATRRARLRGFTLLEMMTVIGIIAVLSALAGYSLLQAQPRAVVNEAAKRFVADALKARSFAVNGSLGGWSGPGPAPAVSAVALVLDPTNDEYLIQARRPDGSDIAPPIQTVDLATAYGSVQVNLSTTAVPPTVVFGSNGAASRAATVTFSEASLTTVIQVEITRAGLVRLLD